MDIKPGDEVEVSLSIKVEQVVSKMDKDKSLVWGWTREGVYVCVPMRSIVEKDALV